MPARRSVSGQFQDRLACLVPELLTHRGEQPFTAVAGMTRGEPPARISNETDCFYELVVEWHPSPYGVFR